MFYNVLCFIETKHFSKRTDISFRSTTQQEQHSARSMLLDITNFNIIENISIDYMYCLLL